MELTIFSDKFWQWLNGMRVLTCTQWEYKMVPSLCVEGSLATAVYHFSFYKCHWLSDSTSDSLLQRYKKKEKFEIAQRVLYRDIYCSLVYDRRNFGSSPNVKQWLVKEITVGSTWWEIIQPLKIIACGNIHKKNVKCKSMVWNYFQIPIL